MWNAELTRPKKEVSPFFLKRGFLIGMGVVSIVVSVLILGLGFYESFLNGGRLRMIKLPGFHELKLDTTGLYAGVYQHRGTGPLPIKELTQMDVRVMSKDDYEEVPVLMNSAGQTFNRFGFEGLPLFNFAISRPGTYTLSGVYTGAAAGPEVPILVFPQAVQNVKQTLFVAIAFFVFFLGLGIFVLLRANRWSSNKK